MLIRFTRPDGASLSINPAQVRLVIGHGNGHDSLIYFAKDHYVIVQGDHATITDAISRPGQI